MYHRGLLVVLAGAELFLNFCGGAFKAEQEDQTPRIVPHPGWSGAAARVQKQVSVRQDSFTHYYSPLKGMKTPRRKKPPLK